MLTQAAESPLAEACGEDPSFICEWVLERTDSTRWAELADIVFARPLEILLIVLVAWLVNRLARRGIGRLTASMAGEQPPGRRLRRSLRSRLGPHAPSILHTGEVSLRAAARAETIGLVLRSVTSALIWTIAVVTILGSLGIELGPLIASAGIAGVALGFGAQSLVKDFLSGMFMLIEDQYGVGDIVDLGEAIGEVEAVTLRTTRIRDLDGTMWHIPNGEIRRVGNMSQKWARALWNVPVGYATDPDRARAVILETAEEVRADPTYARKILEPAEIWGVENVTANGYEIRVSLKTKPNEQWGVLRELRRRLKLRFDAEGIQLPIPRTMWVAREPGSSVEVDGSHREHDGEADEVEQAGSGADEAEATAPPSAEKTAARKTAGKRSTAKKADESGRRSGGTTRRRG